MTEQNKKELSQKLEQVKKELNELRSTLNNLNDKKEAAWKKKEEVSKKIVQSITTLKIAKKERDSFTKQVKDAKEKRKELNTTISQKVTEIKKLQDKKGVSIPKDKRNKPLNAEQLKRDIEKLEYTIETGGVTFDKEKKMMKEIKEKKKQYEELKKISAGFEGSQGLSKEIDTLRKEADAIHKKVQSHAGTSQEKHESLITTSKEIDVLRSTEKELNKVFDEAKLEFQVVNEKLKQKLLELATFQKEAGVQQETVKKAKKQYEGKLLKQKEQQVEEKIAKGHKLTTEDIIAMQGKH
jgi:uncharacterized coiled-coil DUF342 family protein